MKVVLVRCPSYGVLHPPLSLAYLAAALRAQNHRVISMDLNIQLFNELPEEDKQTYWDLNRAEIWQDRSLIEKIISKKRIERWVEEIVHREPDFVGFSVYTTNLLTSLILMEKIKAKNARIRIIFGGPCCRRDNGVAESLMRHEYVDMVVIGEGEITLQEIVHSYEKRGAVKRSKGMMAKLDGEVVDCGIREPISDLNNLTFPDFSDFNFDVYKEKLVPVLASRGCNHNCAFCDEKSFWTKYRWRDANNVVEEIKSHIMNYGVRTFRFNDLIINGKLSELEKFCARIISEGIEIRWGGYIRVRTMGKKLIEMMKRAGCYFLFAGIESGSQNMLNKFKRGMNIEVAEQLLQSFAEAGISIHTGWIVGFPDESFSDFKQTIDFIKRNRKYIGRVAPANLLTIPPGSPMGKCPLRFGVKNVVHPGEWSDSSTTLNIRRARLAYFNRNMAHTNGDVE